MNYVLLHTRLLTGNSYTRSRQSPTGANSSVVNIPYELTYNLPAGFTSTLDYTFENGTSTSNKTINNLLHRASQTAFASYDPEFNEIVGSNPQLELIQTRPRDDFAYEAGVWVPENNEVWFTTASEQAPAHVNVSIWLLTRSRR